MGLLSFFVFLSFGFHGFHQALVLTHEEASATEKFPYLSVMLRPMQVLEFYGRCATRDPVCPEFEVVFHWWKDPAKFGNISKLNTIRLRTKLNTIRLRTTIYGFHFS